MEISKKFVFLHKAACKIRAETKNGDKMMVSPYQQFSRLDPVSSFNHGLEHAMIHSVILTNRTWVQGKIGCMLLSVPRLNLNKKHDGFGSKIRAKKKKIKFVLIVSHGPS